MDNGAQHPQSARDGTDLGDYGFEFEPHASEAEMEDSVYSTSTIYDPSVLALSPKYQAAMAKRKEEDAEGVSPDASACTIGGVSPVKQRTIRSPENPLDRDDHSEYDEESPVCCFGCLPFLPVIFFINSINVIIGIIAFALGIHSLKTGSSGLLGFGTLDSLIISAPYVFALCCVVLGVLLVLFGGLGIALSPTIARGGAKGNRKCLKLVYHVFILLIAIIFLALSIVNALALSKAQSRTVFDSLNWHSTVHENPMFACTTEKRLSCAGFQKADCQLDNNQTSNSNCPGHFCLDFCRITTDDVNESNLCAPCREKDLRKVAKFVECKKLERELTDTAGCSALLNDDLQVSFKLVLGIALLGLIWQFSTIIISSCGRPTQ